MKDFSSHFWGDKNDGYDILYQNYRTDILTTKEMIHFFEERANLEDYCGKNYIKLGKLASGNYLNGSYNAFVPFWDSLKDSLDKMSALHITHYHSLQEVIKEINKYSEEQVKEHKKLKDEDADTTSSIQSFILAKNNVNKSHEQYTQRLQEFNKSNTTNIKEKEKYQNRLHKAKEEYHNQVIKYNKACDNYTANMKKSCQKFQMYEINHVTKMRAFILSYAELYCNVASNITQISTEFKKSVENSNVDTLIEKLVDAKQIGQLSPTHITEDLTVVDNLKPSPDTSDLISISPGLENIPFPTTKENYVVEPPAKPIQVPSKFTFSRSKLNKAARKNVNEIAGGGAAMAKIVDKKDKKSIPSTTSTILLPTTLGLSNNASTRKGDKFTDETDHVLSSPSYVSSSGIVDTSLCSPLATTFKFPTSDSFNIDILNDASLNSNSSPSEMKAIANVVNLGSKFSNAKLNSPEENQVSSNKPLAEVPSKEKGKKLPKNFTAKLSSVLSGPIGSSNASTTATSKNDVKALTKLEKSNKQSKSKSSKLFSGSTEILSTILDNKNHATRANNKNIDSQKKAQDVANTSYDLPSNEIIGSNTDEILKRLQVKDVDENEDVDDTETISNLRDTSKNSSSTVSSQSSSFLKEGFLKKIRRNKKSNKLAVESYETPDDSSLPSKASSPHDKTLTGNALSTSKVSSNKILIDNEGYSIRPQDTSISVTTSSDSSDDDEDDDTTDDYYCASKLMKIEIKPLNQQQEQLALHTGSTNHLLSLEELKKSVGKLVISPQLTGQPYRSRQARIRNRNLTRCKSEDLDIQDSASYSIPSDELNDVNERGHLKLIGAEYRTKYLLKGDSSYPYDVNRANNDKTLITEPLYEIPSESVPFKLTTSRSDQNQFNQTPLGGPGEDALHKLIHYHNKESGLNQSHSRSPIYIPAANHYNSMSTNLTHIPLSTINPPSHGPASGDVREIDIHYDDDIGQKDATLVPAPSTIKRIPKHQHPTISSEFFISNEHVPPSLPPRPSQSHFLPTTSAIDSRSRDETTLTLTPNEMSNTEKLDSPNRLTNNRLPHLSITTKPSSSSMMVIDAKIASPEDPLNQLNINGDIDNSSSIPIHHKSPTKYNALVWVHEKIFYEEKKVMIQGSVKLIISPKLKQRLLESRLNHSNDAVMHMDADNVTITLNNFHDDTFKISRMNGDYISASDWNSSCLRLDLDGTSIVHKILNYGSSSNSDTDDCWTETRSRLNSTATFLDMTCNDDVYSAADGFYCRTQSRQSNLSDSLSSLSDVASTYSSSNLSYAPSFASTTNYENPAALTPPNNNNNNNNKKRRYVSIDILRYQYYPTVTDDLTILPINISTSWKHNSSAKTVELRVLYNVNSNFLNRLLKRKSLAEKNDIGLPCVFSDFEIDASLNASHQPRRMQSKPHSVWEQKGKRLRWKIPQLIKMWPSPSNVAHNNSHHLHLNAHFRGTPSQSTCHPTNQSGQVSPSPSPSPYLDDETSTIKLTAGALRAKYEYTLINNNIEPNVGNSIESQACSNLERDICNQPVNAKFSGKGTLLSGLDIDVTQPYSGNRKTITTSSVRHSTPNDTDHTPSNQYQQPTSLSNYIRLAVKTNFSSGIYLADHTNS